MAVAIMLSALPCGAVLAEQISTPLPGTFPKPKPVQKARPFRPTMPERNPLRPITAVDLAVTPDASNDTAVASAAGVTAAAAFVAEAGDSAPASKPDTAAAPSGNDAANAEATEAPTGESVESPADTTEPAATETASSDGDDDTGATANTDAADASASADESAKPEASETADAASSDDSADPTDSTESSDPAASEETDPPADASATAAAAAAEQSTSSEGATETADASSSDEASKPDNAAETSVSSDNASDDAAAQADDAKLNETPGPAAEIEIAPAPAVEPAEEVDAAPPAVEPVKEVETSASRPEPAVTPQTAQSAPSVTLTILPPPEPTSPVPADSAASEPTGSTADEAATETASASQDHPSEEKDEQPASQEPEPSQPATNETPEPPIQTAALTPPSEPAPAAPTSDDETETAASPSEEPTAEPETTPAETPLDAAPDATEAADKPAAELPAADETAPAGDATEGATSETAPTPEATEGAASDAAADAEQPAAEPAPPPAHPIVAEARLRLADPEFQKTVDPTELKGLEAFYNAHSGPPLWVSEEGFSSKAQDFIAEIEKADEWGLEASAFHLPPPNDLLATQNAQADDELILSAAILKYARHAQGGRRAPSKVSPLFDQKPPIQDANTVLTEAAAATDPGAYLASLHPQHEQFKLLREALLKARAKAEGAGKDPDTDRDVQLVTINMERWRWMPRSLGAYHVWNNVPAFNTRVVKNGKTIYSAKTIVGQFKYATPFFSAPMRNIVFHPDWTVPTTILKEDLAPRLQGPRGFFGNANTDILRQHDLRVSFKGEPVDPDQVDWNSVNIHQFTFTQPPGPANVLGQLKFNFPNRHAIYMHDTPQRELFAETVRTLSHGCIRVNEPDRLAAVLLAEDKGWSQARVESLLAGNQSTVVPLNRPVPVHLTYFTAMVAEDGTLEKLGDIYGIDNRMAASLFKTPVRFEVPATPAIAEAGSAPQGPQGRDARRARGGGGGLDDLISGLFGN